MRSSHCWLLPEWFFLFQKNCFAALMLSRILRESFGKNLCFQAWFLLRHRDCFFKSCEYKLTFSHLSMHRQAFFTSSFVGASFYVSTSSAAPKGAVTISNPMLFPRVICFFHLSLHSLIRFCKFETSGFFCCQIVFFDIKSQARYNIFCIRISCFIQPSSAVNHLIKYPYLLK